MAEWTYALASVEELKTQMSIDPAQSGQDLTLERVLRRASEMIESHLGRQVVTRGNITEYHTFACAISRLRLSQWPLITVTSVKEGGLVNGTWTADLTLQTTSGDYVSQSSETGAHLVRLNGGQPWAWATGFRAVQVVYSAGYATTAAVPDDIRGVCLDLAARKYSQIRRGGDSSAQTVSDALGSVTRFLPADLLRLDEERLFGWRNLAQNTTVEAV